MVKIAVLEGRYGEVRVDNPVGLGGSALAPLAALKTGDAVQGQPLERSLLLLQDTPGVEVKSTLRPGASTGTTDLLVGLQKAPWSPARWTWTTTATASSASTAWAAP